MPLHVDHKVLSTPHADTLTDADNRLYVRRLAEFEAIVAARPQTWSAYQGNPSTDKSITGMRVTKPGGCCVFVPMDEFTRSSRPLSHWELALIAEYDHRARTPNREEQT